MTPTTVLVTGARGKTGREVAARLADRDEIVVRAGSSDPARIAADGVEPVAFDWARPEAWTAALDGVDAVYLMRPDLEDAPALVGELIAQAPPSAHVVLLSEMGAEHQPPDGWVARVERAVTDSGRPWTILRPTWFQQVLTDERFFRADVTERGVLPMPTGARAAVSWVDAGDIAAVAVATLTSPGHVGRAYAISGPAALDADEVARLLTVHGDAPVRAVDPAPEETVAGLDPWVAEVVADLHARVRAGGFGEVVDTVGRVAGRPPRSLDDFLSTDLRALAQSQRDRA